MAGDAGRKWAPPDSAPPEPTPAASGTPAAGTDEGTDPGRGDDGPQVYEGPLPAPLRPLTVSDVLDGAFRIIKLRPAAVIGFSAALVIPGQILAAFVYETSAGPLFQIGDTLNSSSLETNVSLEIFVFGLLAVLPMPFAGAFLTRLVWDWYGGSDPTTRHVLRSVWKSTPALIGAFLIVHVLEAAATAVFIVGGIFAVPFFLVVAPAIEAEGLSAARGIARSWKLVSARYGWALVVVGLSAMIAFILYLAFTVGVAYIVLLTDTQWSWVLNGVGASVAQLLATPVVAGAATMFYLDLRFRKEGLDLEIRAGLATGEDASNSPTSPRAGR